MAKRIKHVFSDSYGVAHIWAQQNQNDARTKSRNCYFEDKTVYSYGSHFPIASFAKKNVVLFTTAKYSNTTSKHKGNVYSSIPHHCKIFDVPKVLCCGYNEKENHAENLASYKTRIIENIDKASRSRLYTNSLMTEALRLYAKAKEYKKIFEIDGRIFAMPKIEAIRAKAKKQKAAAKRKEIEAEQLRQKFIKIAADIIIPLWRKGQDDIRNSDDKKYNLQSAFRLYNTDFLRVHKTNGTKAIIETSQKVKIIAKAGGKVLPFIEQIYTLAKQCRNTKTAYSVPSTETISIGESFILRSIDKTGQVTVGCHRFLFSEIENIVKQLQD